MKIIITENQFKNIVQVINEGQVEGDYFKLTPQEYLKYLKLVGYSANVTKIKEFKKKPLYITGKLDVSGLPVTGLGNVAVIDGDLDISNTKISSIKGIDVRGRISDWKTPIEARRIREAELVKEAEVDGRRENNDWGLDNPDIDEEGLAANVLFKQLVKYGELNEMDEETKDEIKSKMERHKEIQEIYGRIKDTASEEELEELENEDIELLNEIEELKEQGADVYYIIPENYKPYGNLHSFNIVGKRGVEYMVGLYENMYDAAVQNQEDLLDDVGVEGLSSWLIESNIYKQQVREFMEESYRDWITESPESHFDKDDFKLTDEQEERKEELENYINEMEDLKTKKEEELEELRSEYNPTEEDTQDYLYNEISDLEEEIEQIEENIEKTQDEFDSIEPDTEPTEEMIEKQVKYYIRTTDEIDWLKEHDYDLKKFVDMNGVAKDIVNQYGLGVLASYDNSYDDVTVKTTDGKSHSFVVMRMN